MQVQTRPASRGTRASRRATIRLRVERFDLMTAALQAYTDVARAELIGVTDRTVRRAKQGIIGGEFVAATLAGLGERRADLAVIGLAPTFDELFEIVVAR